VAALPARRFYGVGPRTAERMARLGIHTGADLRERRSLAFLEQHFGKSARYLYNASRGVDERPVRADRQRKSIGGERTYADDLLGAEALHAALDDIVDIVWERIARQRASGRTVTLKVKFEDFQQITRSRSVAPQVSAREDFARVSRELLEALLPVPRGVRLLGLTLSALDAREEGDGEYSPPQAVAEGPPRQAVLDF
jgi:DNA polymerase-4